MGLGASLQAVSNSASVGTSRGASRASAAPNRFWSQDITDAPQ